MFFDTHAHYDDPAFADDLEPTIERIQKAGVGYVIDPGSDVKSTERAMQIASSYDRFFFAAGVHPEQVQGLASDELDAIAELAEHPKCVAIGEIGLDYYWDATHKEEQKIVFRSQLALACDMNLPVIIHDREAHGDCLELVSEFPKARGVFHCFSGSAEMAERLVRMGFYLGFDGPVTYKNNRKVHEVLAVCPVERILLETDSPYLSPVPMRGTRNDSSNLSYICAKVAEIKQLPCERMEKIAYYNAKTCFGID